MYIKKKSSIFIMLLMSFFLSTTNTNAMVLCRNDDGRMIFASVESCPVGFKLLKNRRIDIISDKKLKDVKVNIDFKQMDMPNMIKLLRETSGTNIIIDGEIDDYIEIKINSTLNEIFYKLINDYDFCAEIFNGSILVRKKSNLLRSPIREKFLGKSNTSDNSLNKKLNTLNISTPGGFRRIQNKTCDIHMRNGRTYTSFLVSQSRGESIKISKEGMSITISYPNILHIKNCYERKSHKAKTNHKLTVEYGKYEYRELLQLSFQQLHDMWIKINKQDNDFNHRYACSVESALNFAVEQKAIDELEDATTVRGMLYASEKYGEAATGQRYNRYCE